ncbi:ECF RNA polymerase sigma factor SigL [bioreactor metagenome]|uniref:ECF RNA polymerase sigma factor SigL n=1 Tax=bioreactor metagenome TaxID=1076179 RepID=A0A644VPL2_9ZZZZ
MPAFLLSLKDTCKTAMNTENLLSNGDIKEIYAKYHSLLCFYAYKYTKSYSEAEDVVQSVFTRLIERKISLSNENALKSYLFSAVRNSSLNHIKRDGVKKRFADYTFSQESDADNSGYLIDRIETEILFELFSSLDELPKECNKIFRLSYIEGMSNQEIADKLGISVNTVKSQKSRAKQLLKESLKELFVIAMFLLKNYN